MDRKKHNFGLRWLAKLLALPNRYELSGQREPPDPKEIWVLTHAELQTLRELRKRQGLKGHSPSRWMVSPKGVVNVGPHGPGLSMEMLDLKRMRLISLLTFKIKSKGEELTMSLGWFIPRKYRNDIIGDILEDCAEMRQIGCTERRIKFHVVYQWLIAVITLVPTAIKTSIVDIVKQVVSKPK